MSQVDVFTIPIRQYLDTFDERVKNQQLAGEVVYTFMGRSKRLGNKAITANAILGEPRHQNGLVIVDLHLIDADFRVRTQPIEGIARDGLWAPETTKNTLSITTALGHFTVDQAYLLAYDDGIDMSLLDEKSDLGVLV